MKEGTILTPRILENLGFENFGGDYKKGTFIIYSGHHEFWYWSDGRNDKIETINDLENIYKEITGNKL